MALDKETLQEIKAYMDERNAAIQAQHERDQLAGFAALEAKRDERLRNWLKTISLVSGLSVIGLVVALYFVLSKQAESVATSAAEDFLAKKEDLATVFKQIEEQQNKTLTQLVLAANITGQAQGSFERLVELTRQTNNLLTENKPLFEKLAEVDSNIEGIAKGAADNPDFVSAILEKVVFPSGVIVASVAPCNDLAPQGEWSDFKPAIGRTIVGAGRVADTPFKDGISDKQVWFEGVAANREDVVGGTEEVTLEKSETPDHSHRLGIHLTSKERSGFGLTQSTFFRNRLYVSGNDGSQETISALGNPDGTTGAHNNMPPYIALYLCRKG